MKKKSYSSMSERSDILICTLYVIFSTMQYNNWRSCTFCHSPLRVVRKNNTQQHITMNGSSDGMCTCSLTPCPSLMFSLCQTFVSNTGEQVWPRSGERHAHTAQPRAQQCQSHRHVWSGHHPPHPQGKTIPLQIFLFIHDSLGLPWDIYRAVMYSSGPQRHHHVKIKT